MRFLRTCAQPGCAELVERGYCAAHTREVDAAIKERTKDWRWVYRSRRWAGLRRRVLFEQPWCDEPGCMELSRDVDHIVALQDGGAPFRSGQRARDVQGASL